jgi:hypothetical protein
MAQDFSMRDPLINGHGNFGFDRERSPSSHALYRVSSAQPGHQRPTTGYSSQKPSISPITSMVPNRNPWFYPLESRNC